VRLGLTLLLVAAMLHARPVSAQSTQDQDSGRSIVKVLVGAAALAIGTTVAAKSSTSTTVSSIGGTSTTSSFSKSQLITGLSIAGVGGIVLWDGLRHHDHTSASPSTRIGVSISPSRGALWVTHRLAAP
jgi:hypothetical protein